MEELRYLDDFTRQLRRPVCPGTIPVSRGGARRPPGRRPGSAQASRTSTAWGLSGTGGILYRELPQQLDDRPLPLRVVVPRRRGDLRRVPAPRHDRVVRPLQPDVTPPGSIDPGRARAAIATGDEGRRLVERADRERPVGRSCPADHAAHAQAAGRGRAGICLALFWPALFAPCTPITLMVPVGALPWTPSSSLRPGLGRGPAAAIDGGARAPASGVLMARRWTFRPSSG